MNRAATSAREWTGVAVPTEPSSTRGRSWLRGILAVAGGILAIATAPAGDTDEKTTPPRWGEWTTWGDQGDGTYRNPVLPSDYSDLDCIRVGADYYAISSTMQFSPGMVVLHSKDLVNWRIAGHVVDDVSRISPEMNWDRMNRYARGVWAGAIRHHDGKFWVYFGTPDEGYFMSTATDAAGPWTPVHGVLAEAGWDDCCPFWDADGQGWFVGTNFKNGYKTWLFPLSADGQTLQRERAVLLQEGGRREANKLYRIDGTYYHLFSEFQPEVGRYVMMRRAEKITGPYSEPRRLARAQREAMEPNQGGLVQAESGAWFWFTHHGTGAWEGRAASLLPVTWRDGWPLLGAPTEGDEGSMVWSGAKPAASTPAFAPQTSDEFSDAVLAPQWEWNHQPRAEKWSLTERPGFLRLHAFRGLAGDNLLRVGNVLTQRTFRTSGNCVTVRLELAGLADEQHAGLCLFSAARNREKPAAHSASIGVVRREIGKELSLVVEFSRDGAFVPLGTLVAEAVWLRATWERDGIAQFSWSADGEKFTAAGEPFPQAWGSYRGSRIGVFTFHHADADTAAVVAGDGHVDVDWLHYEFDGPGPRGRLTRGSANP